MGDSLSILRRLHTRSHTFIQLTYVNIIENYYYAYNRDFSDNLNGHSQEISYPVLFGLIEGILKHDFCGGTSPILHAITKCDTAQ